jgi:MinD-like ATPase involved in chromosome partitioning or flagellar assembly
MSDTFNNPFRFSVIKVKGGVGGSVISLSIAKYFSMIGHNVLLVDRDTISTASMISGIRGFGLIQLVKNNEDPFKSVISYKIGSGKITVLKILSEGIPVEKEQMDLKEIIPKLTTSYKNLLKNEKYDIVIVDSMPAVTPLDPIVNWETSTYYEVYGGRRIEYNIIVLEPNLISFDATVRYYNILKNYGEPIVSGVIINKVRNDPYSISDAQYMLVEVMNKLNSSIGCIVPELEELRNVREGIELFPVPTQIMELGNYLIRRKLLRKLILPTPYDPIKRTLFTNSSAVIKINPKFSIEVEKTIKRLAHEIYDNIKVFLLTTREYAVQRDVVKIKLLPAYFSDRVKIKGLEDVIKLSKKLADETISYLDNKIKNIVILHPSNEFEPISDCCDPQVLSKVFWREFVSQLMNNVPYISLVVICERSANYACESLDGIMDFSIDGELNQDMLKYYITFSRIP